MERRKFFKGTALSFAAVPFLTTVFHSAGALASEQMTDDEADYANWSVSPMTPGGQIRYKIIMAPSVQAGNEATCKLVRFVRGVTVPRHMHPEGELTYLITGTFMRIGSLKAIFSHSIKYESQSRDSISPVLV